ncbi:MAG: YcnI family protein [Xanthobacteraceae bacterium]|nr:YcnI family protein [Xanthobacteraceae bacterium]MCW5676926.1 YcnI family protein [Xanthobacteraceae bacterium]
MFSFRAFACAALGVIAGTVAASSHPTLTQKSASADSYFRATFTVPHGCDGAATTKVSIWLPENIIQAKPQSKAGWKIEIVRVKLDKEVQGFHGAKITHRVAKVIFSGGNLPDDQFDEFTLSMKLPKEPGALYFPVEQACGEKVRAWNEIPSPSEKLHDLDSPAAALTVTPKQ